MSSEVRLNPPNPLWICPWGMNTFYTIIILYPFRGLLELRPTTRWTPPLHIIVQGHAKLIISSSCPIDALETHMMGSWFWYLMPHSPSHLPHYPHPQCYYPLVSQTLPTCTMFCNNLYWHLESHCFCLQESDLAVHATFCMQLQPMHGSIPGTRYRYQVRVMRMWLWHHHRHHVLSYDVIIISRALTRSRIYPIHADTEILHIGRGWETRY